MNDSSVFFIVFQFLLGAAFIFLDLGHELRTLAETLNLRKNSKKVRIKAVPCKFVCSGKYMGHNGL